MFQRISVIGLGYIGLPTAALFARSGYDVVGVDIDPHVIDTINAGQIHIVEPELDGVVHSVVANGRLRATLTAEPAEAFMIAVPTPVHDGRTPDVSYIQAACATIAPVLAPGNLVVLESTSPVGTTRQMERWLAEARPDLSFPKDAGDAADVQIAFANELSMICEKFGVNVWELIGLANRHPRVNILQPGAGVGGHCIAVDPWFIIDSAPQEARLIRMAREVNDSKPHWVLDKGKAALTDHLAAHPGKTLGDLKLACLGLAFKPDIDDLRESPALEIAAEFTKLGCEILAVEPHIDALPRVLEGTTARLASLEAALAEADVICVLVKHSAFRSLRTQLPRGTTLVDVVGL